MKVQKCDQAPIQPANEPISARHLLVNPEVASPESLLTSLREKQKLFETLKNEGLIHKNRHANLEHDLAETIRDLEKLMKELEPK